MKRIKIILTTLIVGQLLFSCNGSDGKENNPSPASTKIELIVIDNRIGVRQGKAIKFYDQTNVNWIQSRSYTDFNIPNEVDELIVIDNRIGVRQGKAIKFYDQTNVNWIQSRSYIDFNISN